MIDLKAKKTDLWKPHFDTIVSNEDFNVRTEYGDIEALAESIKISGLKVALRGYRKDDQWFITDGHRRYRAIKLLRERGIEFDYIPFIVEPRHYTQEDRVFDLFLTNDSKPLTELEQGEVFKRLINYGYSIKEISDRIQKSETHISKCLEVNNLPKKVKTLIKDNRITSSAALAATKRYSTEEIVELVEITNTNVPITASNIEEFKYYFTSKDKANAKLSLGKVIKSALTNDISSAELIQQDKNTKEEKVLLSFYNNLTMEYDGRNELKFKVNGKIILVQKLILNMPISIDLNKELNK